MATVSTTASKTRRADAVTLAVLGGASLFRFAVPAVALWHGRGPVGIDDALGSAKTRGAAGVYLGLVADFGSPWFVGLAALMLAVVAHAAGDRLAVAVCVVVPVLAGVCELVAKPAVDRLKESALSYPSGHAIGAAAVAALVVLVRW